MLLLWEDLKKHCEVFKYNFHLLHLHLSLLVILKKKNRLKEELHRKKNKLGDMLKLSNQQKFH